MSIFSLRISDVYILLYILTLRPGHDVNVVPITLTFVTCAMQGSLAALLVVLEYYKTVLAPKMLSKVPKIISPAAFTFQLETKWKMHGTKTKIHRSY